MYFTLLELIFIINVFVVTFADANFIINTKQCNIPEFPAFSEEANNTYSPQNYTKCSEVDNLTFTTVENNIAYLHIKQENKVYYTSHSNISCCYGYVRRNGFLDYPDVGIRISNCENFDNSVQLTSDIVKVKCYNDTNLVYENVHNPIIVSRPVKKKLNKSFAREANKTPISVLFIVIDSISRLNLIRTMPRTRQYLLDNNFIEFVGYNKIDDNTFPNFNALLTGLNLHESLTTCNPKKIGKLDNCPMIWYDFRDLGYATAYAEDWAALSTYNYLKKGFTNPPTDYYFKPYVEAFETLRMKVKDSMPYCAGSETEEAARLPELLTLKIKVRTGERILNLAKDYSITFKNQPSFGIFWMNTFSHNYINSPSGMDGKVETFFQDLNQNGILNESVVILLSDHGIRTGVIRRTIQGWYEERLPVNLISLPPWFKRKYSEQYNNLKQNANKLTSTYDLYMTLQDILNMSVDDYNVLPSKACAKCMSLFSTIPDDRTCQDAGIPEEWCTCIGRLEAYNNINETTEAANLALEAIKLEGPYVPQSTSIRQILSSSITSSPPNHFLIVVQTNTSAVYQALFEVSGTPVQFHRIIQLLKIEQL